MNHTVIVFDSTAMALGEGPLWHPQRNELFWFDILSNRLYSRNSTGQKTWAFGESVSAAGWIDEGQLLIASASSLSIFQIESGQSTLVIGLESDNPLTRSNDGRADPLGGFWIGTMGHTAASKAGAIYRYYKGELRQLYANITIPNAICFSPDGESAYFCDTHIGQVMRQRLSEKNGWPVGSPEVYLDLSRETFGVDGAVVDAQGNFWNAQWGASRIVGYSPAGKILEIIKLPATQITCPAFGGHDLSTLYATSSYDGINNHETGKTSKAGQTFEIKCNIKGQPEHQVAL